MIRKALFMQDYGFEKIVELTAEDIEESLKKAIERV